MPEFKEHKAETKNNPDLNYKPSKNPQAPSKKEKPQETVQEEVQEVALKTDNQPIEEFQQEKPEKKEGKKPEASSNLRGRWKRSPQADSKSNATQAARPACGEIDDLKGFQEKLSGTSPHEPKKVTPKTSETEAPELEEAKPESNQDKKPTQGKQRTRSEDPAKDAKSEKRRTTSADRSRRGASDNKGRPQQAAVTGSLHTPKTKSSPGFVGAIKKAIGSIFGGESETKQSSSKTGSARSPKGGSRSGNGRSRSQRSSNSGHSRGQGRSSSGQRGEQRSSGNNRSRGRSSQGRRPSQKSS